MNHLRNLSRRQDVTDPSQVAEARRCVASFAGEIGFDVTDTGRASLVASEMATNLLKHAGGGVLLMRATADGLELLAVDPGAGMADPSQCLRDGFSTAGSAGTGLGAIRRLSDGFDLYSRVGTGTVVLGRLRNHQLPPAVPARFTIGAVCLPVEGESVSGDGWVALPRGDTVRVAVFDGLGHGPDAADAATAALDLAAQKQAETPAELLQMIHQGIRHTRGAAGAVHDLHAGGGTVCSAGVGNITSMIVNRESADRGRLLMTHNGTLGHVASRFQDSVQPWAATDLLIVASDGLTSRWDLTRHPGLLTRDPAIIAAVLWRDFNRGRDDATVLVIRES